ncbi:MAG: hypothetical protein SX243_05410 [Acidobacteriota bacterium]|nr:hypothetical protein [Acidobacteriota bacterium]
MTERTVWAAYLVLQAILGVAWWGMLLAWPESRGFFLAAGEPEGVLFSFWLAEIASFVGGSAVCGWLVLRGSASAQVALWLTAGAVLYAALYCLGRSLLTGDAWLATLLMLGPAALTTLAAARHG